MTTLKEEELSYIQSRRICLERDIKYNEKEIEDLNKRELEILKND
jgi:hypothetical protein